MYNVLEIGKRLRKTLKGQKNKSLTDVIQRLVILKEGFYDEKLISSSK